jgi:diaminopimelate epimerase
MHGIGNDYIYVDCFAEKIPSDISTLARKMTHRHFGVGGDGLILIRPSDVADARMQMLNVDGSEGEMCGNGIRCVAKYVYDHDISRKQDLKIETGAGILDLRLQVDSDDRVCEVTVNMGRPETEASRVPTTLLAAGPVIDQPVEFAGQSLRATCVSMGNPHCVIFVERATDELVLGLGPKIETDPRFPNRTNVEFVETISDSEFRQRTWERGSGETWACGTGASAVCVAAALTGRGQREIQVHLLGGDLRLHWVEATDEVMMTGSATEVFHGEWALEPNLVSSEA